MPTARLIPSTYSFSNTNYLTMTNADNMYENTDSDTYATITNTQTGTTTYYIYIKGFNFDDIPSNATVSSFSVKFKARESGLSTSTSYRPYMVNNTTTITGTASMPSTTATPITFTGVSATWATIKGYGLNFGIRISVRRSSRNTTGYLYVYGAEIEVNYTVPAATITSTLTGNGTIDPLGAETVMVGDDYELVIVPANFSDPVTAKRDGTDITAQLVFHNESDTVSAIPGSDVTTGFSESGANFYQNSSTSSDAWLRYAIGHSAESPYSTTNTSNTYVKDSSGGSSSTATGWMNYPFDFSDIPPGAVINSVQVKCYGARENATINNQRVARVGLYSGGTLKSTVQDFTSTSNGTITISSPGTWTRDELEDAQLRFEVGYYGGRLLGATWTVSYSVHNYTYTFTVTSTTASTIDVMIGVQDALYWKNNGSWVKVLKGYKKVNGVWVEQDITSLFSNAQNYKKGA